MRLHSVLATAIDGRDNLAARWHLRRSVSSRSERECLRQPCACVGSAQHEPSQVSGDASTPVIVAVPPSRQRPRDHSVRNAAGRKAVRIDRPVLDGGLDRRLSTTSPPSRPAPEPRTGGCGYRRPPKAPTFARPPCRSQALAVEIRIAGKARSLPAPMGLSPP